ncbi:MAG TPA: CorA family divalent cation transporter, partial [Terrimesophilobacter sp.]|nr:CorA family divalent cation transporter [Terrimesophilobacter sp.]
MVTIRLYRDGVIDKSELPFAQISDRLTEKSVCLWIDITSPTQEVLAELEEELGLHHLAVEDALHHHQRPKLDRYDTHLFLATYAVQLDERTGQLHSTEVKAFITPRALVTVHPPEFDIDKVVHRWDADEDLAKHGVAFLLWGLLDVIVDGHFDTVQQLDGAIESLEDA